MLYCKRRDARAVEWGGLENRCMGDRTGGSNPPLSAIQCGIRYVLHPILGKMC